MRARTHTRRTKESLPGWVDDGEIIAGAPTNHQIKWTPLLNLQHTHTHVKTFSCQLKANVTITNLRFLFHITVLLVILQVAFLSRSHVKSTLSPDMLRFLQ